MAEKLDRVQIELDKKYLKLEKKYVDTVDKISKLDKDFLLSNTKKAAELKTKKQKVLASDKDITSKKKAEVKEAVAKFNQGVKANKEAIKKANDIKNADDLKIAQKLEKEEEKIAKALETINNKFEKAQKDATKDSNLFIAKSKKEIKSKKEKTKEALVDLKEKADEHKAKHNEKLATLKEKSKTTIEKIKTKNAKETTKLNKEILAEEKSTKTTIKNLKPVVAEKLSKFEKELAGFEDVYNEKVNVISTTLKEKNDRHQKFLDKAIKDNDPRSQKLHKKEISDLTKNANQELKILKSDFEKSRVSIDAKIKEIKTQNVLDVKVLDLSLAKFIEEKKFSLNTLECELALEINKEELSHSQKVKDEEDKDNKYISNINLNKEDINQDKELLIVKEQTNQAQNLLNLENQQKALVLDNKENIAGKLNEKELANLSSDIDLAKVLNKETVTVEKLNNEIEVSLRKIDQDKLLIEEDKMKELHENDFAKQSDLNNDYQAFLNRQTDFSEKRFDALVAYETLEIENRLKLTLEQLDKQIAYSKTDNEVILTKINSHFEEEKALFDKEIKKIAGDLLVEKDKLVASGNKAINAVKNDIEALDSKADKKRIKLLNKEIQVLQMKQDQQLDVLEKTISLKTTTYQNGIYEANERQTDATDDTKALLDVILDNLEKTAESISLNAKDELNGLKEKSSVMKSSVVKLNEYSKERKAVQNKQNEQYKEIRLNNEAIIIADTKQQFETSKFDLNENLDSTLQTLSNEIDATLSQLKQKSDESKQLLEKTSNELATELAKDKVSKEKALNDENIEYKQKVKSLEEKFSTTNANLKKDLQDKVAAYKVEITVLEKQIVEANKLFETSKKTFVKEQSTNTIKRLTEIENQAKLDIKEL
ncbi:MAG: hypothetical protein QM489_02455 [Candidatus Izemoplasma sp.]